MNNLKTLVLLATLTALLIWIGQALGGQQGFMMGLLLAGFMNLSAYWWSDKIVLRMYGAQEVSQAEAPELYEIVRNLAHRAEIPMPKVYVIHSGGSAQCFCHRAKPPTCGGGGNPGDHARLKPRGTHRCPRPRTRSRQEP